MLPGRKVRQVRIAVELRGGLFVATSPDFPLMVSAKSEPELQRLLQDEVPKAMKAYDSREIVFGSIFDFKFPEACESGSPPPTWGGTGAVVVSNPKTVKAG